MQPLILLIISLLIDASFSWIRMFIALFFSIVISLAIGIYAARSENSGRIIVPILDVFQTLPILAFFPFVIYIVVNFLPGYVGINAAVIFLIITSMVWNISFGVYEAVRTLPKEFSEVAGLYHLTAWQRLTKILIPASMPHIAEQSVLSWSIGLFYLVTSEIFSTGSAQYSVKYGIGVALTKLAFSNNLSAYLTGILVFVIFVVATRFLFFRPFERYSNKSGTRKSQAGLTIFKKMLNFDAYNRILKAHRKSNIRAKAGTYKMQQESFSVNATQKGGHVYIYIAAVMALIAVACLLTAYPMLGVYEYEAIVSLLTSLARVWLAFAIILIVAVPLCIYLIFISKHSGSYMLLFQIIASIPATILLPIMVLALNSYPSHGELVAFAVYFLSGIWYVIFSLIASTRTLPANIFDIRKLFHVKGVTAIRKIYLKALLPGLVTGAVTAIAAEWNASIVAEYFTTSAIGNGALISSVSTGMGKLLDTSLSSGNLTLMFIGLVNLVVMILLVNTFVWKRLYGNLSKIYE